MIVVSVVMLRRIVRFYASEQEEELYGSVYSGSSTIRQLGQSLGCIHRTSAGIDHFISCQVEEHYLGPLIDVLTVRGNSRTVHSHVSPVMDPRNSESKKDEFVLSNNTCVKKFVDRTDLRTIKEAVNTIHVENAVFHLEMLLPSSLVGGACFVDDHTVSSSDSSSSRSRIRESTS